MPRRLAGSGAAARSTAAHDLSRHPKAFSGDIRAQALVAQGMAADFDRQLRPIQRVFIYLVFEHCEHLAVQNEGVALHRAGG
jgi:uncharacterized protein (DUF924 family)